MLNNDKMLKYYIYSNTSSEYEQIHAPNLFPEIKFQINYFKQVRKFSHLLLSIIIINNKSAMIPVTRKNMFAKTIRGHRGR